MQPYNSKPNNQRPRYTSPRPAANPADRNTERLLSVASHAAIAFGLLGVTFPISLLVSGVIWLYSRRSPYVRYHSGQAGCYQCSVLLINVFFVVALGVGGGFSIVNALRGQGGGALGEGVAWGLILFAVWFALSILFGLYAALMVLLGRPFKYPLIGG